MQQVIEEQEEVQKFERISNDWWLNEKSFHLLHKINPIRINYIRKALLQHKNIVDLQNIKILDVGCGGGLVSIPLAKLGAKVTALDAGAKNIQTAKDYAKNLKLPNIEFICESIENYNNHQEVYDVVLCLELIEHVEDQNLLLQKLSSYLKKGGILVLSTITKTYLSWFLSIVMAENILRLLPRNTHDYKKFITPIKIKTQLECNNIQILDIKGLMCDINQKWYLSQQIFSNFLLTAIKV